MPANGFNTQTAAIVTAGVDAAFPDGVTPNGTVTLNGTTPVTVTDSNYVTGMPIIFTLLTVGGTVGAYPSVKTVTSGTGFTVAGTASDTSIYNYFFAY
jgi:hypothetical protein